MFKHLSSVSVRKKAWWSVYGPTFKNKKGWCRGLLATA